MVLIADLVARVRTEGVEQIAPAAKQARAEVAGIGQEARATGDQLDQLARKFAATQGGTPSGWREILEKQNLSAAQVSQQLGTAATNASRLSTAAQQVAAPTQAAAKAAAEVHEGFRLSESSAARFALGIVGIGAGLSIATKVATELHNAISGTIEAQTEWERSLVRTRILYGDIADQVVAVSRAQALAPGEAGGQVERIQANLNASFLATRYGVPMQDVYRLTGAAAATSRALGLTDPQQRRDLQARALAFAESGGEVLRDLGTEGTPLAISRRLGGVNAEQLQAFTEPQLVQIRTLMASEGLNRAALEGDQDTPGLLAERRNIEKALTDAQTRFQNYLEGGTSDDDRLRAMIQSQQPRNALEAQQQQEQLAALASRAPSQEVENQRAALEANIKAINDHTKALADERAELARRGIEVGGAVFRILSFLGNPEDPLSIARGDVGAQTQSALAARMRSAVPSIGTPNAEIAATSTQDAYSAAYQNYTARLAQQNTDNAYREFLQRRAGAEVTTSRDLSDRARTAAEFNTPAGRAIREAEQTAPVLARMREVSRTGQVVDMQAAQQQADLEAITLRQRERGLQLLRDTVDLRRLDVQQQQLGLQTGMAVIRAQQAAQGPQNRLEDAQFQSTQAAVLAQARMARQLQGKDVSDLPTYDDLIQQNQQGVFAAAEAGPAALDAARAVQLAQRPATAAGLAQQVTASQLQLGQLAVDLKNLGDLPEQTALELELVQTNRDQLAVQKELRDATKELVRIMGGQPAGTTPSQVDQMIGQAFAQSRGGGIPASSQLAGARR